MKNTAHLAIFGVACLIATSTVYAAQTTCVISEKVSCAKAKRCTPIANTIVVRVDWDSKIYSRCDSRGCTDLEARFSQSGTFINIDIPGTGMFAKLAKDGSDFVEVVSLATTVIVSFGSCK